MRQIQTISMPEETQKEFKAVCEKGDLNKSKVVVRLIENWLSDIRKKGNQKIF